MDKWFYLIALFGFLGLFAFALTMGDVAFGAAVGMCAILSALAYMESSMKERYRTHLSSCLEALKSASSNWKDTMDLADKLFAEWRQALDELDRVHGVATDVNALNGELLEDKEVLQEIAFGLLDGTMEKRDALDRLETLLKGKGGTD